MNRPVLWMLFSVYLVLSGCNRNMGKVSGKVTLDGKLLTHGTVVFQNPGMPMGVGTIQSDGSFTILTGDQRQLLPGEYRVTVSAFKTRPGGDAMDEPIPVLLTPLKYNDPETSGLRCTVKPGGNQFDIPLDP